MQKTTTVRVSRSTRDELRGLADLDGVTLDEEISKLVRRERQRRMGVALSDAELTEEDQAWIAVGSTTTSDHEGR